MGREKRKYSDRAAYMVKAVDKRRKLIRKLSIEYKGGRCEICGYYAQIVTAKYTME